ncbi:HcpE [Helicobacter didelphidarum]|uniref:Beta-lactamase n=1 Tax=Helicobacter didelphidarum TaxID=2040648 RepID=A0A3D8IM24_9HELI|nr:tetratricopeptide repeat protein [Helicobacter didelphidarum]RDU66005.1 HcpE [Helicobacter didelphidarum]
MSLVKRFVVCSLFTFCVMWSESYWGNQSTYTTNYGKGEYDNRYQSGFNQYENTQITYDVAYRRYKRGDLEGALQGFALLCQQQNNFTACFAAGIVQGNLLSEVESNKKISRSERKRKQNEYYGLMMGFYTKACNGGNYDACNNLAFYEFATKEQREKNKKEEEQEKAQHDRTMDLYAKSCKAGNKEACQNLGVIYSGNLDDKNGQNANLTQAENYWSRSCTMGDSVACFNLGVLRYNHAKSNADYAKAVNFFNQACDNNYAAACLNLGIIYERGVTNNADQDIIDALQYYTKACYYKSSDGCSYLSKLANKQSKRQY